MRQFSLEKAKQGHPVCTRDGRDVEILKFDFKSSTGESLLGIIKNGAHEIPKTWFNSGRLDSMWEHSCDLFLKSQQKEGWVNVYNIGIGVRASHIYDTKEEALYHAGNKHLIDTVPIKWKE
jgi:hypothetical protein